MGIICSGHNQNKEIEINKIKDAIIKNPVYQSKESINKIETIQRKYKSILAKKKLNFNFASSIEKSYKELDKEKLINYNIILESKSEKFYNKLLSEQKIKKFEQIIDSKFELKQRLIKVEKYSFLFPFYVVKSDKEVYKGSWNCNKKYHGYGVVYEFNIDNSKDSRTEGIFIEGFLIGFGRIFLSKGEILIGNFAYNKLNGLGEYHRNDGSIYRGGFFEGLPQGDGKEIYRDGSYFEGFYLAGKKKYGKFKWKDGNFYQGDFQNDLFDGFGMYKWGDNRTYDGNWKLGKMNGKGKLMLSDGSYYEGDFLNGKKHGNGIYVWAKNKYYEGDWKNDKQNGLGIYNNNGKIIKGFWINGVFASNRNEFSSKSLIIIRKRTLEGLRISNHNSLLKENKMMKIIMQSPKNKSGTISGRNLNDEENKKTLRRNRTNGVLICNFNIEKKNIINYSPSNGKNSSPNPRKNYYFK